MPSSRWPLSRMRKERASSKSSQPSESTVNTSWLRRSLLSFSSVGLTRQGCSGELTGNSLICRRDAAFQQLLHHGFPSKFFLEHSQHTLPRPHRSDIIQWSGVAAVVQHQARLCWEGTGRTAPYSWHPGVLMGNAAALLGKGLEEEVGDFSEHMYFIPVIRV